VKHRIPIRTLVIDDDETVCRRLQGWLDAAAYDVMTSTKAGDGLRLAERVHFELALVDLRMPEQDGADVIASLHNISPSTRVVAMSAFPDPQQVIAAMRAGASDLLEKPIQEPTLLAALDRQLAEVGCIARTEADFNRRLGARLRHLRRERGLTLSQVTEACGITPAQLSQIELGKTATTTWTLARICGAMKAPLPTVFAQI
jgi:DNA-binding NtrC family response regulator